LGVLSRRAKKTLAAVARTLVPPGGSIAAGADELGLVDDLVAEVNGYPRRARRRMRLLLFATEYLPLVSGHARRFSALGAEQRLSVLEYNGRHRRSPLRRLIVSYLKQLVYSAYISHPVVEDAVGYRYECARPREGIEGERVHH
jgi:hypothetical protein